MTAEFIAENVKGIMTANKREAFPIIIREFEDSGYSLKEFRIPINHAVLWVLIWQKFH